MIRGKTSRAGLHYVDGTARFVSTKMTEIVSQTEVVLRCGKSVLRIKPDGIEMVAPQIRMKAPGSGMSFKQDGMEITAKEGATVKAKKVKLKSETGELTLSKTATVMAPQVNMCTDTPSAPDASDAADEPTTIALEDKKGKPIPYQHYVVISAKGDCIGGIVGKDGKDEIFLEQGDEIVFPERAKVEVK
jgi:hypothetical protein